MQWGRSNDPRKQTALRRAQYAYSAYIQGTERAYMVEDVISYIVDAYGLESLDCVECASKSLAEEDEGEKQRLMALALRDILSRQLV